MSSFESSSIAITLTPVAETKRKTVLVYTSAFPPALKLGGGCALRYYTIVKNLLKDGAKVLLFSPIPKEEILTFDSKFNSYVENGSLLIESLPWCYNQICPGLKLTKPSFGLFVKIYSMIRAHDVDLFLCPDNTESSVVLALAKLAGAKATVYGIHTDLSKFFYARDVSKGFDVKGLAFPVALFFHHIACSRIADHSAVSSEAFRKEIQDRFFYRYVKLDGAFESMLWSPHFRLPKSSEYEEVRRWRYELTHGDVSAPLMVYVGRWSDEKRIFKLPAALPKGWRLAMVGDGPDGDASRVLACASDKVVPRREFIGPKDLGIIYACADFLVSASDFETFGFVALESLACGTPVAVQNAGGFKETVEDGSNGLLVDFDNPAETIARLEEYAPGTAKYDAMKKRVVTAAIESEKNQTTSFVERLFRRHAPHLLKSDADSKYQKRSASAVVVAAGKKVASAAFYVFLWIYMAIAFLCLMAAQSAFT